MAGLTKQYFMGDDADDTAAIAIFLCGAGPTLAAAVVNIGVWLKYDKLRRMALPPGRQRHDVDIALAPPRWLLLLQPQIQCFDVQRPLEQEAVDCI